MAENSKIEWCDHSWNPWIGCSKVSPACDNCYAEAMMDKRLGKVKWGGERQRTSDANWRKPLAWNKKAARACRQDFVFCASLADVFDNKVPAEWRRELFEMIRETTNLTWLLLTKRPQNIVKMLPEWWLNGPKNVWLGTTVESQDEAERRIPALIEAPSFRKFLSCEPLLGEVSLTDINDAAGIYNALMGTVRYALGASMQGRIANTARIDWVISGGESGPGARPTDPEWFYDLRDQCASANVPFFFKQWGDFNAAGVRVGKKKAGRLLEGKIWDQRP